MRKLLILIVIVISGCVVAGLYGILHDQLTYTISPEYYTKFKFYQFGLAYDGFENDPQRLLVSIVGFFATWWMGIPIGIILGIYSLHFRPKLMLINVFKGFAVTMVIAFISGLCGLFYGFIHLAHQPRESFRGWFIPDNLVDFERFMAVGSMHNASYLGGLLGLLGGIVYLVWQKTHREV